MSIVTKTGDQGETGIIGGKRVPKDDARLDAYGTVDELNAHLGVCLATPGLPNVVSDELTRISHWLFDLGCDLATPNAGRGESTAMFAEARIGRVETWIAREESTLPELRQFILPGGHPVAAQLHVARTVCRRAERAIVGLKRASGDGEVALIFLNRLSDLLFMYARRANHERGHADVTWSIDPEDAAPEDAGADSAAAD